MHILRATCPRGAMLAMLALATLVVGCNESTGSGGGGGSLFGPPSSNEDVWGIQCAVLTGKDRMQYAKAYAESLKKVEGLKPALVQVFNDAETSTIYYGRYEAVYTAEGGIQDFRPDNKRDLQLIRGLSYTASGVEVRPFKAEMQLLPLSATGKPEWNLENVAGYWSLQVAVFYNTSEMKQRRQAAEEYCKLLRDQGEQAFYHHGPARSSVCIGTFPYDAIAQVSEEDPMTGRITAKAKIVNKKLLDAQKKFPNNLENGFIVYNVTRDASGKVVARVPNTSFPVELPRADRKARQRQGN